MTHEQLIFIWFLLIAVLWIGFFFLEGFDFGVAMLYPVIGKDPTERRVMINTVGPTWDGNEVWLITAGGAMFAAFPGWYATLFSGLYLPLLLVLLGLIARGVAFEYRALMPDDNWRDTFDWSATIGSLIVSLVLGIAFAGDPPHITQGLLEIFHPFGLLGGALTVTLFIVHGAVFLCLKTADSVREKANRAVKMLGPIALALLAAFIVIGNIAYQASNNPYLGSGAGVAMWVTGAISVAALGYAIVMHSESGNQARENQAFIGTGLSILMLFVTIFIKMYGTLGFVSADDSFNMNVAASTPYTLRVMSIAALIFVPIVLAYSAWSYYIFRKRISTKNMPAATNAPVSATSGY